jgi:hypothetical protein
VPTNPPIETVTGQTEIDHLHQKMILFFVHDEHHIRRLDIAMDQFLSIGCDQCARNLPTDPESEFGRQRTLALDTPLKSFALDILHRIVKLPFGVTEVKNRRDVRVAQAGRSPCFP